MRTAIITGAAGGIGYATARMLALKNYRVVMIDIQQRNLNGAVKALREEGNLHVIPFFLDISKEYGWKEMVKKVSAECGEIDALVNNAGVSSRDKITECEVDYWNQIIDINLTGTFLGMKTVIPYMQKSKGGSIVNVSSIGGLVGIGGGTVYPATKGAIKALSKRVAIDYGKEHIRVNTVYPGWIETAMTKEARPEKRELFLNRQALPYAGTPEDVAAAIVFLLSDEAKFITGADIVIDGGFTAT